MTSVNKSQLEEAAEVLRKLPAAAEVLAILLASHAEGKAIPSQRNDSEQLLAPKQVAAMRIAPVALLSSSLEQALAKSDKFTVITHDHPEGLKGARATVEAIWLAAEGMDANSIQRRIEETYGYDLSTSVDDIRPDYSFNESCAGTVPQAIICALEADGFEDAIRKAISLGGDSDTLACITGGIAEARFGVPEEMKEQARARLPQKMVKIIDHQHFV